MFNTLSADFFANKNNLKGLIVVFLYRVARWVHLHGGVRWGWGVPYLAWYRFTVEWVLGVELPWKADIGAGLSIHHGQGLVVNPTSRLGKSCVLRQGVTIGNKGEGDERAPVFGDNVDIGCGAIVLGAIEIGSNVTIGAGSVVLQSLPNGAVAVGNPARIVKFKD